MDYTIKRANTPPVLSGRWLDEPWRSAQTLTLDHFHERSTDHRPEVDVKVLYNPDGLFVFFRVFDRYVRCVHAEYQSPVCQDSCVEFFVEPRPSSGYFNFEVNCGGALLLSYIEDPTRVPGGFTKWQPVPPALGAEVQIYHSMPSRVEPELWDAAEWRVAYFVPISLFAHYLGPLGELRGQTWRANFYKCADQCSHPHWASWAPIVGPLNFHRPDCFAPIRFEE